MASRRGRSVEGRAEVRHELMTAAVALFRDRGYDDTTVDDIAGAAGVGRRTFFRYFRGKEDAVSPDHETGLARVAEVFGGAHPDEPTASLVLRAGETVLDLYAADPRLSVDRFRLTHAVPALRDRESASVDGYRRLFTRHLRRRFVAAPDGELRAAVIGASVVAAHNVALRSWLAAGAPAAGIEPCRLAFRRVAALLPPDAPADAHGGELADVARRLEAVVGRLEQGGSMAASGVQVRASQGGGVAEPGVGSATTTPRRPAADGAA